MILKDRIDEPAVILVSESRGIHTVQYMTCWYRLILFYHRSMRFSTVFLWEMKASIEQIHIEKQSEARKARASPNRMGEGGAVRKA